MRRAAATIVLLLLVGAAPAADGSGTAPPHQLWYRTTIFGIYEETQEGISGTGIIDEYEYVSWSLRSNTATILSRGPYGFSVGANLSGRIDAYDRSANSDVPIVNTGARCIQRARFDYWAGTDRSGSPTLSGAVNGVITKPAIQIAGGGEIEVEKTITFACPGGASTTTGVTPLAVSGLAPALLPPRELLVHGLSAPSRISFGRFFSVRGDYTSSKPLGELFVGATGNWVRHWEIEIWSIPCPNLRC
jgi:hypothetical protein